jgi:hypothetical protein
MVESGVHAPGQPADNAMPSGGARAGSAGAPGEPGRERPGLLDATADLIQLFVDYLRQEAGDLVQDKVVQPTQKVGQFVAFAFAAAFALILGMGFISVGLMMLLARLVGWPAALLIIGAVFSLGAGVLTMIKMRRAQ